MCFVEGLEDSPLNLAKQEKKNKTKSIKILDLLLKNWKLRVWCSLFHFFSVSFARYTKPVVAGDRADRNRVIDIPGI